jgi:hypothetical protein
MAKDHPQKAHTAFVLRRAEEFDVAPIIERYSKDSGLPRSVCERHSRELKRFLALAALNPRKSYGMAGPADNFWHTFLIFTERYQEFCEAIAGQFLHHVPATEKESLQSDSYQEFLRDYAETFSEAPPQDIWPGVNTTGFEVVEQLNAAEK